MIDAFARALKRELEAEVENRREALTTGLGCYEKDERKRGEVVGLRIAIDELDALVDKARRRENEE